MGLFSKLRRGKERLSQSLSDERKDIKDFFNIDLENISVSAKLSVEDINVCGNKVVHYTVPLEYRELDLFNVLQVIEVGENEYNLWFIGDSNELSNKLIEFIRFYTDKYGPDRSGQGYITDIDYRHVGRNLFSRMWDNLWIDNNSSHTIELTIFGIHRQLTKQ